MALTALGTVGFLNCSPTIGQTPTPPLATLDGSWELVAMVEDGRIISNEMARTTFINDGRIAISGSLIRFARPGGQDRMVSFVTNSSANPKTLDLAGTDRVGSRGIYLLDGDNLVVCLKESHVEGRPATFSASAGSDSVLLTFRRVGAAPPMPPPPAPVVRPAYNEQEFRRALIGRWGHQNDQVVKYITVNNDGTFSEVTRFKKGFKKLFDDEERSSGTWKLEGGNVVYTVTASTDRAKQGQIHSLRVVSVGPGEVIYIDNETGGRRVEWKLPG
jgi:uncharacterized protein (TIGR03067 family)